MIIGYRLSTYKFRLMNNIYCLSYHDLLGKQPYMNIYISINDYKYHVQYNYLFNIPLSAILFTASSITGTGSTRANRT